MHWTDSDIIFFVLDLASPG